MHLVERVALRLLLQMLRVPAVAQPLAQPMVAHRRAPLPEVGRRRGRGVRHPPPVQRLLVLALREARRQRRLLVHPAGYTWVRVRVRAKVRAKVRARVRAKVRKP